MNKRSNGKMKYRMLSILGLVIFFGVWEAAVRLAGFHTDHELLRQKLWRRYI